LSLERQEKRRYARGKQKITPQTPLKKHNNNYDYNKNKENEEEKECMLLNHFFKSVLICYQIIGLFVITILE